MQPAPKKFSPRRLEALRGKACRVKALAQAKLYVGLTERPAGSNRGPHIERWQLWANGITGYAWCAAFVVAMFREACGLIVPEPRAASVGFLEQWAAHVGELLKPGTRPRPGDLICYRWDSDDWPDHVGFVDRVFAIGWRGSYAWGRVRTVEGNTSSDSAGDQANGGGVYIRYRSIARARFIRVDAKKLKPA